MPDLSRFHTAQAPVYRSALAEMKAGHKRSHWMWFIFPQLRDLGRSHTARFYGIANLAEARAYLADPVLAARLSECVAALLSHPGRSAQDILGHVDAMKLRSSATLFREAGGGVEFQTVLDRFFDGAACPLTLAQLGR